MSIKHQLEENYRSGEEKFLKKYIPVCLTEFTKPYHRSAMGGTPVGYPVLNQAGVYEYWLQMLEYIPSGTIVIEQIVLTLLYVGMSSKDMASRYSSFKSSIRDCFDIYITCLQEKEMTDMEVHTELRKLQRVNEAHGARFVSIYREKSLELLDKNIYHRYVPCIGRYAGDVEQADIDAHIEAGRTPLLNDQKMENA